MNTTTHSLVQKLWNYCNVLRDDGMSYGDYVEQLTYLLFLKMADERSAPPYNQPSIVPAAYAWPTLLARDGDVLYDHYRHLLEELGKEKGTLGLIFGKAQNKFQDPAKLRRVIVDLIDAETWSILGADVKGDAYVSLDAARWAATSAARMAGACTTAQLCRAFRRIRTGALRP